MDLWGRGGSRPHFHAEIPGISGAPGDSQAGAVTGILEPRRVFGPRPIDAK